MSTRPLVAATFPPGPYHVRPASQTSGWGTCVSADHEIVARIPGRNRARVGAIARLLAAAPELFAEVQEHSRQLSATLALLPCVAGVVPEADCAHCHLAADVARLTFLLAGIHSLDSDHPPLFAD